MNKVVSKRTKTYLAGLVFVLIFSFAAAAQKKTPTPKPTPNANLPKVTQIDETGLKTALKPNGKPLLVNFWATWCDPCREEFPELVQIDAAYKGKIDFITISLDDLAEIGRDVPKFLADMKAEMPAYLLKVADEGAAISTIAKDWNGGLPFTVLYNQKGEVAYLRQGKIKIDVVKTEIDKLLPAPAITSFEKGKTDAQKDAANGVLKFKTNRKGFFLRDFRQQLKEIYGIDNEYVQYYSDKFASENEVVEYTNGYNSISEFEIEKRFGAVILKEIKSRIIPMPEANIDEVVLTVNYKQ